LAPFWNSALRTKKNTLTADSAAGHVSFWRDIAQQLFADSEAPDGSEVRHNCAHMAQVQANPFAANNFDERAEQAYRIARTLAPDHSQILGNLSGLLAREGRLDEGNQLPNYFARSYPKQETAIETIRGSIRILFAKPAN
jgi:hypothetical protein